ncbi:unnamed protein product [Porites evermanni]|uniref:Cilia- and flagella-associated protein 69 ARM repeats domain-containing protein n=1 Tax=Porites evermanni TaxID=104178 RepID=A0ABN8T2N1_9CNID|nr:unnamed protein product [Porites evermanni]
MLSVSAAGLLCSGMNIPDPSDSLAFRTVEILWNLLEFGSKQEVANQLNCKECISALKDAFIKQIRDGYSLADRQLRNDLLVISSLVVSLCPTSPFLETGFTRLIVVLATFTEVKSHHELVRSLKLDQSHEDFEFKKLLMNALVLLSSDSASFQIFSEGRVILSLFSFVRANDSSSAVEWSPAQFEELQLQALDTLSAVAPLCLDDYMTCQSNTRLLMLLEWCVGQADYGGHGNSFHGSGGRGNKRSQMRFCLRLIRSMVSVGDDALNQDLVDQGAIGQVVGILLNASTSPDENDSIDVELQCDMLFIVSSLCEVDTHRKELFGSQGVQVLVEYLKRDPDKINSPLGHHRLLLSAVDCVWSAVLGCYLTEQLFLENDGIFHLMDLLEVIIEKVTYLGEILSSGSWICLENNRDYLESCKVGTKSKFHLAFSIFLRNFLVSKKYIFCGLVNYILFRSFFIDHTYVVWIFSGPRACAVVEREEADFSW